MKRLTFRLNVRNWPAVTLVAGAMVLAFPALVYAQAIDLSGTYTADDGGIYYVQQSNTTLWWTGMSLDSNLSADMQWHRGLSFTNVFKGTINSDGTITGEWSDVTRGAILQSGSLTIRVGSSGGVTQFSKVSGTGGFGASSWTQRDALDDAKFKGNSADIYTRFDETTKSDGTTILDNLKPYRDQTVVYGRVVNAHVDYISDNHPVESEIPHVNYGVHFSPDIKFVDSDGNTSFTYLNFGGVDRTFHEFFVERDTGDGDFDVRLKVDQNKLEPDFYTTGWGNHTYGPEVYNLKLNDATTHQKLGYAGSEAYMGLETIMFGKQQGTGLDADTLLPGWADVDSNSVLVNGRPINGAQLSANPPPYCDFVQPCPFLDAPDPQTLLQQGLFVSAAGIALGNLLESAYGDGNVNDANNFVGDSDGTYVRVTGALILDCGHLPEHGYPCFDGDNGNPDDNADDVSTHQNQELHPVYSVDIINYPFRPEDITVDARPNLTGTYGGADGSTYYVRQLGNTIWWLGMMRDRQPIQRGTDSPIIGEYELQPAFDAGDPSCGSNQCWAFANVFHGTVTESPSEVVIEGDWAGVPQSTSLGSKGAHMKFFVYNHKIIVPATASIFPVTIEKMYNPQDITPPASSLTIGTPQYPTGASQPFVTGATTFTLTATDPDSDVQNVWYRYYRSGTSNLPAYTPVSGSSTIFNLSGADGLYEVDTYATDDAGNDETAHSQSVYLDATAPVATIVAPVAKQYVHSDTFIINYSVSDGSGSGVKSATADIDGLTTLYDGATPVTVANGATIRLLTELGVGTHTFNVHSVDNLNNVGTNSVTFSIVVTAGSIITDVKYFRSIHAITQDEATSLLQKLNAAAAYRAKGDCVDANASYQAFINELIAQKGKKVTAQAATILIADARYLIAHCP